MKIDINCDLGEGAETEEHIMPYISSANIACGYHAGDIDTIQKTIRLAIKHDVKIGAHPGYNDKPNFGRIPHSLSFKEIKTLVKDQVSLLKYETEKHGTTLHHVKAHGALYNQAAKDENIALAICEAIADIDQQLIVIGLPNSKVEMVAKKLNLLFRAEAFADRAYTNEGHLAPRDLPNAVIHDAKICQTRVFEMIEMGKTKSISNKTVLIKPETICIHGDNSKAIDIAKSIYLYLTGKGVNISAH